MAKKKASTKTPSTPPAKKQKIDNGESRSWVYYNKKRKLGYTRDDIKNMSEETIRSFNDRDSCCRFFVERINAEKKYGDDQIMVRTIRKRKKQFKF